VYADFLRIVLEILNCMITTNLPQNPELVYALLHRQEVFSPFQVRAMAAGSCSARVRAVRRLLFCRDMQRGAWRSAHGSFHPKWMILYLCPLPSERCPIACLP
jgi:hypothetical protein